MLEIVVAIILAEYFTAPFYLHVYRSGRLLC